MNWKVIKDENDIKYLMDFFDEFHDSCIKEIKYISGAYVGDNRGMCPFNEIADLSIIFQTQFKGVPTIEIVFKKIDKFNLRPENAENYTCELFGASLEKIGDFYFWANEPGGFDPEDYSDEVTWVSAKEVQWRTLDNALGEEEIYCTKV